MPHGLNYIDVSDKFHQFVLLWLIAQSNNHSTDPEALFPSLFLTSLPGDHASLPVFWPMSEGEHSELIVVWLSATRLRSGRELYLEPLNS